MYTIKGVDMGLENMGRFEFYFLTENYESQIII